MLPAFYRYVVVNNSGQTLTYNSNGRLTIKATAWHYNIPIAMHHYKQMMGAN